MKDRLQKIRNEAIAQIKAAGGMDALNDIRVSFLGKKGELTAIMKSMRDIPPEERPAFGQMVNEARQEIENSLDTMISYLNPGGRLCIITFHSLEDRIVKRAFKELETDCICDKSLPVCVCGKKKEIEVLTKHPLVADKTEQSENARAKSAKLRIAEKV